MASRTLRHRAKSAFLSATLATSVLVPLSATPALAFDNGRISGRVTETSGDVAVGLGNICVQAFDQSGNPAGSMDKTVNDLEQNDEEAIGEYDITDLRAGVYSLRFRDCGNQRVPFTSVFGEPAVLAENDYITGWYAGGGEASGWFESADTIAVTITADNAGGQSGRNLTGIDAVLGQDSVISGSVTDHTDSSLLGGVCVQVLDAATGALVLETVSSDGSVTNRGAYAVRGLVEGAYKVHFRDDLGSCGAISRPAGAANHHEDPAAGGNAPTTLFSHDDEYWNDKQTLASADAIQLPANGGTGSPIDAALTRISQAQGFQGTVRDDSGNGAGGVCVSAYDSRTSAPVNTTTTNASGGYTLSVGKDGQYWVEVHERCVGPVDATHKDDVYVAEVHPNVHYADKHATTARVLTLTDIFGSGTVPADSARQTVSTNTFTALSPQVAKRGSIAGTVTDSASPAQPLSGVCVVALQGDFAQADPSPFAVTDAQGAYTIPGVRPSSYVVRFLPVDGDQAAGQGSCPGSQNQSGFLSEYYDSANALAGANQVVVGNGSAVTGRNATLRPTGSASTISGRVTRDGSSNGAVGVCVRVLDLDGNQVAQTATKAADATSTPAVQAGDYTTPAVAAGQYLVQFLRAGAPGANAGDAACPGTAPALTSPDYIATEWFNNQTREATAQAVTVGTSNVANINNSVAAGARIAGAVTGNGGSLICVELLDAGQTVHRAVQTTGGAWALEGIVPGTWTVRFDDQDPGGTCAGKAFTAGSDTYRTEFFQNKFTFGDATPVIVGANAERTAIDAAMNTVQPPSSSTASLTGYVYDPDLDGSGSDQKRPINGVIVEVFRFNQDPGVDKPVATGTTKSLDPFLRPFIDCPASDVDDPTTDACEAEAPPTPSGPATDDPIVAFAPVVAGHWRIDGIPLGSYKVRFRDPQGIHATEWYRGRNTFATAFSVVLDTDGQVIKLGEEEFDADNYDRDQRKTAPLMTAAGANTDPEDPRLPANRQNATVADLEAAGYTNCGTAPAPEFCTELRTVLALAGNVAGRVTVEQTGVAAKDVRVDLLAEDTGNIVASAFTGSDGRYQVPGVLPGGYKVKFTPSDSTLKEEFYDNQMTFGAADVLAVGASTTRSNINAALAQNTAPRPGDDRRQAEVNKSTTFTDLMANDVDPEADPITIKSVGTATHGTVVLNQDGSVTYTPAKDNKDTATFTYTVADTRGLTGTATVTVDVVGQIVGVPPKANDDEVSTPINTSITIAVLANDSDPDGDSSKLELTSVGVPFHGTATIQGRSIFYTPTRGFSGLDQFSYDVTDTQGFTSSAKVTVAVNASGVDSASKSVSAGGTVATEGSTANADNPIITTVTSPNAGTVTIKEEKVAAGQVSDISTLTWRSVITAPNATAGNPLTFTFRLDGSLFPGVDQPARAIRILRDNALVHDCLGSKTANPDPCVSGHRMIGDDLLLTIKTSRASTWTFGFDNDAVVDRASGAAGTGRVGTAVAVSRNAYSPGDVDTVVIARKDAYPDALAGAPLAHQLGAPMLLTTKDSLDTITRDEIVRLGATRVVILGGTAAVSSGVETALRNIPGVTIVDRLRGADRYATAAVIAQQLTGYDTAYVVEGADADPARGWPDAVAVAGLAAFEGRPILLVTTEQLPAATRNALSGLRSAVIVGGTASVSTSVQNAVDQVVGTVTRVRGTDRYETSFAVAQRAVAAGMSPSSVWVATGRNFPDALAAGPAVAREGGILLLVHGTNYDASPAVDRFLKANRTKVETLTVVGGTAVISVGSEVRMAQATTN